MVYLSGTVSTAYWYRRSSSTLTVRLIANVTWIRVKQDFSLERQIEKDVKTIDASAKTLVDASKVLADLVGQIGCLTSRLEKANVVRISSKTKEEMSSMAVQMVTDAANVLDAKVKDTVEPYK